MLRHTAVATEDAVHALQHTGLTYGGIPTAIDCRDNMGAILFSFAAKIAVQLSCGASHIRSWLVLLPAFLYLGRVCFLLSVSGYLPILETLSTKNEK